MARNVVKEIRRATRRKFGAEEKIRIVLEGLRGEISVASQVRTDVLARQPKNIWKFVGRGKAEACLQTKEEEGKCSETL